MSVYLRVVDVKLHIRRHHLGLDRRQVRADHLRRGEQVAHLDGPVANTRGHIEDELRRVRWGERGKVDPAVEEFLDDGPLKRQSLPFRDIVGVCVCCGTKELLSAWPRGDEHQEW